jgi:SAM-dependent methyltransferase
VLTSLAFDPALAGLPALLRRSDGTEEPLDVARWRDDAAGEDAWLLDRCSGASVDLGCGPGRLVAALVRRGLEALGVDQSATAALQCRRRGVPVLRRDLFGDLPGEAGGGTCCWRTGTSGSAGTRRG